MRQIRGDAELADQMSREELAALNQGTQPIQPPRPDTQEQYEASLSQQQRESPGFQQAAAMNRELMDQRMWADIGQRLRTQTTATDGNPGIPPAPE